MSGANERSERLRVPAKRKRAGRESERSAEGDSFQLTGAAISTTAKKERVRAAGLEPTTFGSGGRRSIQLSYARN